MSYNNHAVKKKQKNLVSKSGRNKRKFFVGFFKVVLVVFVVAIVALAGAGFGMMKGILDNAPDISTINIQPKGFKTTIYNQDGEVIDTLSTYNSNRVYVYYDEIPEVVRNAFVAIEDERYWEHNGIDIQGIFRAFVHGIQNGFDQGASTITQQLIKNQVFNVGLDEVTFMDRLERKIQEQYLAIELEKIYSKEEILEYYLNTIYLGQGVHGVEAAAERYFNKSVGELTLSEAAVIAGITQNPYKYDPVSFSDNNADRRKMVLDKMLELEYITQSEYDEAMNDDVYSRIQILEEERVSNDVNSYYTDEMIRALIDDFMEIYGMTEEEASMEVYTGGYSVYSVQDQDIQDICDSVINNSDYYPSSTSVSLSYQLTILDSDGETNINYGLNSFLKYYREQTGNSKYNNIYPDEESARAAAETFKEAMLDETGGTFVAETFSIDLQPQASFVIMDQHTGYVKAVVGGRGEKKSNLSLDRATMSLRQPGSTFKVLAAFLPYIDTGGSLASAFEDAPYYYENGVQVTNWYGGYRGDSSIRDAIRSSMNVIAVKVITEVTPEVAYEYLINLGFTSLVDERVGSDGMVYSDITQSTALGGLTDGVSNLEITAAYAAIANGGVYNKPVFYSQVYDHDGNLIIDNTTPESHEAMKATTAWMLLDAMKDVVISGTGTAARMTSGVTCAGKTGTTSSNYDVWFCGMTPYYTASIWMGYDSNVDMGSTQAHKKMWRDIMDQIAVLEEQSTSADFERPDGISSISVCQITGLLPGEGCPTFTDYCAAGTGPSERCEGHETILICTESHEIATNTCPETMSFTVVYDEETGEKTLKDADFEYTQDIFNTTCHIHPESVPTYTISSSAGEGGGISSSVTVDAGSTVTMYITPYAGYSIQNVIVDGVSVGVVSSYTFTDVQANHSISVTFTGSPPSTETPSTSAPPTESPPSTDTEQPSQ